MNSQQMKAGRIATILIICAGWCSSYVLYRNGVLRSKERWKTDSRTKCRSPILRAAGLTGPSAVIDFNAMFLLAKDIVKQCPNFGQPGWGPFCFLNGNPVFAAFDGFQSFVQGSVISLHDLLTAYGLPNAYGPSIILFTVLVRCVLFPLNYYQLSSSQKTLSLNPKILEIKSKYGYDKNAQNQMVGLLYQETKVNPLAGCFPALMQIPVFLALYRSFFNLAAEQRLAEPFLWLPNLEGPVFGERSIAWLTSGWHDYTPALGWTDTLSYLSVPVLLYIAQAVSLRVLTPPSDDPAFQRSQRLLKYLPLMLAYFSLSVPSGLGLYWITSNVLSTATTAGIKAYLKAHPDEVASLDVDQLARKAGIAAAPGLVDYASWGISDSSEEGLMKEAATFSRPARQPKIPAEFV